MKKYYLSQNTNIKEYNPKKNIQKYLEYISNYFKNNLNSYTELLVSSPLTVYVTSDYIYYPQDILDITLKKETLIQGTIITNITNIDKFKYFHNPLTEQLWFGCLENNKKCIVDTRDIMLNTVIMYRDSYATWHPDINFNIWQATTFGLKNIFNMDDLNDLQKQEIFTKKILIYIKDFILYYDELTIKAFLPSLLNIIYDCIDTCLNVDYIEINNIIDETGILIQETIKSASQIGIRNEYSYFSIENMDEKIKSLHEDFKYKLELKKQSTLHEQQDIIDKENIKNDYLQKLKYRKELLKIFNDS